MFELLYIKETWIIAEQLQVVPRKDSRPRVKQPESKSRAVGIRWLSFQHLLLSLPRPPELTISISKGWQVNGVHPWLLWEHVTEAKPVEAFHASSCRNVFKEACGSDPVRENIRTLVQMRGWRCFLPSDDMGCQGEVRGYSSHFSSGGGEGREERRSKHQERELELW